MPHRIATNETYHPDGTLLAAQTVSIEVTDLSRLQVYDLFSAGQRELIRTHAPELFERLALAPEPISVATIESYLEPVVTAGLFSPAEVTALINQEIP